MEAGDGEGEETGRKVVVEAGDGEGEGEEEGGAAEDVSRESNRRVAARADGEDAEAEGESVRAKAAPTTQTYK